LFLSFPLSFWFCHHAYPDPGRVFCSLNLVFLYLLLIFTFFIEVLYVLSLKILIYQRSTLLSLPKICQKQSETVSKRGVVRLLFVVAVVMVVVVAGNS
jgi:hypothetical protein